jgi:hypothetical protein
LRLIDIIAGARHSSMRIALIICALKKLMIKNDNFRFREPILVLNLSTFKL